MASRLRMLGIIGAVLLLAGPAIIGAGYLNAGAALGSTINCTSNCASSSRASLNASVDSELFLGIGLAVGGVGVGLVLAVAVQFMSRRDSSGAPGNVPLGPSASVPPPLPPPLPPPPGRAP